MSFSPTFKVIKEPFGQLFAIHDFIRSAASVKQVPLFFAAMSHRQKRDYIAVLSAFMNFPYFLVHLYPQ